MGDGCPGIKPALGLRPSNILISVLKGEKEVSPCRGVIMLEKDGDFDKNKTQEECEGRVIVFCL